MQIVFREISYCTKNLNNLLVTKKIVLCVKKIKKNKPITPTATALLPAAKSETFALLMNVSLMFLMTSSVLNPASLTIMTSEVPITLPLVNVTLSMFK